MNEARMIDYIQRASSLVICAHTSPDGDAVGASFALGLALKKLGKDVKVVLESYNKRYDIIPGKELLYNGDLDMLNPDVLVVLDCSSRERIGKVSFLLDKVKASINIDHHATNTNFASVNYVYKDCSSTSELVYSVLIYYMQLDSHIASCLYGGIIYDTGGLRFKNTKPSTLDTVKALIGFGIPFTKIYDEFLLSHSLPGLKILARALERLNIDSEFPIAYTYISTHDLDECGATKADLDGIVEYSLSTYGVEIAIFAYSKPNGVTKLSLRSTALDISGVAQRFGGGGHENAAGCDYEGELETAIEDVLILIKDELKRK